MRDWSSRLSQYGASLCASIPGEPNTAALEARLSAVERRLDQLEVPVQSITNETTVVSSDAVTWYDVGPYNTPFSIADGNKGALCNTLTSAVQVKLPSAALWVGKSIYIKDASNNASVNNITVTPSGAEKIDGDSNVIINGDGVGLELQSDGNGIRIV